jgi:hypothetical protein
VAGEKWKQDSILKLTAGLRFFDHTAPEEINAEVNYNKRFY